MPSGSPWPLALRSVRIGEAVGIHKAVRIMKQFRCASERTARSGTA